MKSKITLTIPIHFASWKTSWSCNPKSPVHSGTGRECLEDMAFIWKRSKFETYQGYEQRESDWMTMSFMISACSRKQVLTITRTALRSSWVLDDKRAGASVMPTGSASVMGSAATGTRRLAGPFTLRVGKLFGNCLFCRSVT